MGLFFWEGGGGEVKCAGEDRGKNMHLEEGDGNSGWLVPAQLLYISFSELVVVTYDGLWLHKRGSRGWKDVYFKTWYLFLNFFLFIFVVKQNSLGYRFLCVIWRLFFFFFFMCRLVRYPTQARGSAHKISQRRPIAWSASYSEYNVGPFPRAIATGAQ